MNFESNLTRIYLKGSDNLSLPPKSCKSAVEKLLMLWAFLLQYLLGLEYSF